MLRIKMFGLAIMVALVLTVAAGLASGGTAAFATGSEKVSICLLPPGNPDNVQAIIIAKQALSAFQR